MRTSEKWCSFVDQTEQRRKYQDFRQPPYHCLIFANLAIIVWVPGYDDKVEHKASDGGDPVGHVECERIVGLKNFFYCVCYFHRVNM